jgi:hypothetical protein
VLFRSEEDFLAWLADNPGAGGDTAARRAAWLAEFPQLAADATDSFAAIPEDQHWAALGAVPLQGFFGSAWFREAAPAFAPRYDELRRRWEAEA